MDKIKLDREELYKLLWEEPITKVVKRFGLSEVGLADPLTESPPSSLTNSWVISAYACSWLFWCHLSSLAS